MYILIIDGSPRMSGNTDKIGKLCEKVLNRYINKQGQADKIEKMSIGREHIENCLGCRTCFNISEGKCPHIETISKIKQKMEQADILIIGSPIYVEDVSGTMKNWIDHMAYNCHRPFLQGKPVYLYTTSGAGASKHGLKTMEHALLSWGATIIGMDNYRMGAYLDEKEMPAAYHEKVAHRMEELVDRQKHNKISLFSIIAFMVQKGYWLSKGKVGESVDYKYWVEKGWLNKETFYYKNVEIPFVKKVAARAIAKLVARWMY